MKSKHILISFFGCMYCVITCGFINTNLKPQGSKRILETSFFSSINSQKMNHNVSFLVNNDNGFILLALFLSILLFVSIIILCIISSKNKKNERLLNQEKERVKSQGITLSKEKDKNNYIRQIDLLTGLSNRQKLYDDLENKISSNAENGIALYYIDINNFKYINDTLGHIYGDEVLVDISDKLGNLLKYSGISIYRIGGDEFAVLLENCKDRCIATYYANKILDCMNYPINVSAGILNVTASVGISIFPNDGNSGMELLRNADTAMYKAKKKGCSNFVVYEKLFYDEVVDKITLNQELYSAINNNEFILYYQPQWDLNSNRISGVEALIRWIKPDGSLVPPDEFITEAERSGLIIQIGEWVLKTACAFVAKLHNNGYGDLNLSVNVSVKQLVQPDFVSIVDNVINQTNFCTDKLTLEITESILMQNFSQNINKLRKLKDMGISIALDDFGKGYSSLSYLKKLPISIIKIDKTFIDDMKEEVDIYFLSSIISIGHKMNMSIVAEGVETESQLNCLKNSMCDKIQGYYISKPLPENSLIKKLYETNENSLRLEQNIAALI